MAHTKELGDGGRARVLALAMLLTPGLAAPPVAARTAPAQQPERGPSFPAGTEVVTVDVVVTDSHGQPVVDLRREDFSVSEDGVPQEIVAFDRVHRPAAAPASPEAAPLPEPRSSTNQVLASRAPSPFVIVFDELHMSPPEAVRARAAVAEFLTNGVAAGDRVVLVGSYEGARWSARLPEGREALTRALGRLQGRLVGEAVRDRMSDYEAMRIDRDRDPLVTDVVMRRYLDTGEIFQETASPGNPATPQSDQVTGWRDQVLSRAAFVYARATARNEQTLGLVSRALLALAAERGRKSLVFVSGGLIQDPRLSVYREVVTEARRANAAVYFLDARGLSAAVTGMEAEVGTRTEFRDLGSWFTEARERSAGSEALAADTGGFSLRDRNDLGAGLTRVGLEARSSYLIGYLPTNRKRDGRFRSIAVAVARRGLGVRARRGYYAPGGDGARRTVAEGRDAAMQRALDAPFDLSEVPLRAIADVLGEAEPGKAAVRVTVEADLHGLAFEQKGDTVQDTLELLLLVSREDTGEFSRFDQQFEMSLHPQTRARYEATGFPITRELPLAPGRYQARVVVRDHNSGRVGSLTHEFEVPPLGGLRLSSLVLTDRLREEMGAKNPPEPTARREFAAAGTLHCRFEVYGARPDPATGRPRATAGFSIRRSDGRFLAAMAETPLQPAGDGTLARGFGVPLGGAPEGRYEMIVVVTDLAAGRSAEAREAFVITAPSAPRQGGTDEAK